jgi:SprT protein
MHNKLALILNKYVPEQASPLLIHWLIGYQTRLVITGERQTKLGDYRPPYAGAGHSITINHNLNKYSFLITLVHEFAHLSNHLLYKDSVAPHGKEWKLEFKRHMWFFLQSGIFPDDVEKALRRYMANPAASSCSDINLMRILKRYDVDSHLKKHLDELEINTIFKIPDGRIFTKGQLVRKRFKCLEMSTKRLYMISPLMEVEPVSLQN